MKDQKRKDQEKRRILWRKSSFIRRPQTVALLSKTLEVKRIIKVTKGGRNFRFFTVVAVGDGAGSLGLGFGKSTEVGMARQKATARAQKNMTKITIVNETIPHFTEHTFCTSKVTFRPAKPGAGASVGGIIRGLMELTGIKNISGKAYGSNNKMNVAQATVEALKKLKTREQWAAIRTAKPDILDR